MDHTFAVSGMHCGACLGRIKAALQPFAETVEVTISPQRATLRNPKGRISLPQLQSAIATAGPYTISPLRDYEMQGSGVDAGAAGRIAAFHILAADHHRGLYRGRLIRRRRRWP